MKNRHFFISLTALALFCASLSRAHHAVHGRYDYEAEITLTGKITRVDWINPHTYVYLDVKNDDGTVTTWGLETGPTKRLRQGGLTKQDLAGQPGEQVTVVGMPALREGNNSLWLIKIAYEEDKYYILYGSPVELPTSE